MTFTIVYDGATGQTLRLMPVSASADLDDWATASVSMSEESSPNNGLYTGDVDTDVSLRWALFGSATQPADWSTVQYEFDLTDEVISTNVTALNDLSSADVETAVEAATFSTSQFAAVQLADDALDETTLNKRLLNKTTLTSTGTGTATLVLYDDDGTTVLKTWLVTDDGTIQTQGAAS